MRGKASTPPAEERVTFFASAKKVTKESSPRKARLPGILPSRCASGLRGSLSARPCARSELARILRAILTDFSSARSPRLTGPRLGGILPQKQEQKRKSKAL